MDRLNSVSLGKLTAICTLIVISAVAVTYGQQMFSAGPLSAQQRRQTARGGVHSHAEITDCAACHAPVLSQERMADRCLSCHDEIRDDVTRGVRLHGQLADANCIQCHREHQGTHVSLTRLDEFDHACTAFHLDGKHASLDCKACHMNGLHRGTPTTCVACHAKADTHQGRLGANCAMCHSSESWKTHFFDSHHFNHAVTGYPLTGKHVKVDCQQCHKNETYRGTPQSCVACHSQEDVHKGRLGANCAQCHSTHAWTVRAFDVNAFDHDQTGFKLTGKHAKVDCRMCHKNEVFQGTPRSCTACHGEPKSHVNRYGKNCAMCHGTDNWVEVTFQHSFPIQHHNAIKKPQSCALCHPALDTFASYTCYGCHQHDPAREARRHAGRKMTVKLEQCATCHPTGHRAIRSAQAGVPTFPSQLATACPGGVADPGPGCPLSSLSPFARLSPASVPTVRPVPRSHDVTSSHLPSLATTDWLQIFRMARNKV